MRYPTTFATLFLASALLGATALKVIAQESVEVPIQPTPLVATGLPGSPARLMAPSQYISPLASVLSRSNTRPSSSQQLSQYYRSRGRLDLSRVPEMFGDFRASGSILSIDDLLNTAALQTEIPSAAGIGGLRIAENNHALPRDRFFVSYNYFHNALDTTAFPNALATGGGITDSTSLDRISLGREFVMDDGLTSIELRMSFASSVGVAGESIPGDTATAFSVESDGIGNLGMILKRLLYADSCFAFSAGLGVEAPTGSTGMVSYAGNQFELDPQTVHLVPFLAVTERYGRWFGHLFTQLDIPLGEDELSGATLAGSSSVDSAALLGVDIGVGYWLMPQDRGTVGIAVVAELHGTASLESDDSLTPTGPVDLVIGVNNPGNVSNDILNGTTGLVFAGPDGWSLRTAIAFPTLSERVFDSEAIVQLNRLF